MSEKINNSVEGYGVEMPNEIIEKDITSIKQVIRFNVSEIIALGMGDGVNNKNKVVFGCINTDSSRNLVDVVEEESKLTTKRRGEIPFRVDLNKSISDKHYSTHLTGRVTAEAYTQGASLFFAKDGVEIIVATKDVLAEEYKKIMSESWAHASEQSGEDDVFIDEISKKLPIRIEQFFYKPEEIVEREVKVPSPEELIQFVDACKNIGSSVVKKDNSYRKGYISGVMISSGGGIIYDVSGDYLEDDFGFPISEINEYNIGPRYII